MLSTTKIHKALLFILLLLPAICQAQITGKVVGVHDGDTFKMLLEGDRLIRVRLHGIDCPELGQPFSKVARDRVADLIAGEVITIDSLDHDRYRRVIGMVYLQNGDTLNKLLIREGLAWHYKKYDKRDSWAKAEDEARDHKRGLWIEQAVAPWDHRKRK